MADVFLSYAKADRRRAEQVAKALAASGWDVWWDAELTPGDHYREEIGTQLAAAECVVVLWSRASVRHHYVIDEAEEGKSRGVLVQAVLEEAAPPHGFRQIQWANLIGWDGWNEIPGLADLRRGISRHVLPRPNPRVDHPCQTPGGVQGPVRPPTSITREPPRYAPGGARRIAAWAALAIMGAILVGLWFANRGTDDRAGAMNLTSEPPPPPPPPLDREISVYIESLPNGAGSDAADVFLSAIESWRKFPGAPRVRREGSLTLADVIVRTSDAIAEADADIGPPVVGSPPFRVSFGRGFAWTPQNFAVASRRMWGQILGVGYTDHTGQLMTGWMGLNLLPLFPQAEDIERARAVWEVRPK